MPVNLFGRAARLGRPFGVPLHVSKLLLAAMAAFAIIGLARKNWPEMVWLPMLSLFILMHEFGHAFAARRFGARVEAIVLDIFGGLTLHAGSLSGRQSVIVSLAGPAVNLGLAVLVYAAARTSGVWSMTPDSEVVWFGLYLMRAAVWVNILWGLFNLAPIWPLDGGQVARAVLLRRLDPARARAASAVLSLVFVAAGIVVAVVLFESPLMVFILASLAYLNVLELRRAGDRAATVGQLLALLRRGSNGKGQPGGVIQPVPTPGRTAGTLRDLAGDHGLMRRLLQRSRSSGFGSLSPDERRLIVYHRNMMEALLARSGFDSLSPPERELLALHHELDQSREVH